MGNFSPQPSPPGITVNSPYSPKPYSHVSSPSISARPSRESFLASRVSQPPSPTSGINKGLKLPSRTGTPALESRQAPSFSPASPAGFTPDPQKVLPADRDSPARTSSSASVVPPPINRAGKPKTFGKSIPGGSIKQFGGSLAPAPRSDREDERVSPFSTPPSEHEELPSAESSPTYPPPVPLNSKPDNSHRPARDSYFAKSPSTIHYSGQELRPRLSRSDLSPTSTQGLKLSNQRAVQADISEQRPGLPPRREEGTGGTIPARSRSPRSRRPPPPPPSEPPVRKSMETLSSSLFRPPYEGNTIRGSIDSLATSRTSVADVNSRFLPPPKRTQTFGQITTSQGNAPPLPARQSMDQARRPEVSSRGERLVADSVDDSEDEEADLPIGHGVTLADYPDSSQANRRPPRFGKRPHDISTKYETKLFAICGEYVCTSGFITRAWSLLTGEQLMSITHGEMTKVTALAFKPATAVEDEGQRIWLGTQAGELLEIDIPTGTAVYLKANAHGKCQITKIYRQASEMWSLDEDGKLMIWPAGLDGLPSLALSPIVCRVSKGGSFSIIVGRQLWIAYGREIMVYEQNTAARTAAQVLDKPLVQANVGDVTAGSMVASQPDRIYFGHIDGKVTIYSTQDYACLGIVNVSLYKISSLVGVGDYLWAGFNTGMIYVYDTSTHPWKVKKDWKAHEKTIAGILVDRTSIWKLDRLQVASLGTDNLIRLWDGMLEDDWLEVDMQEHDADFCDFREVSTLIMTWNAGASKPTHLSRDQQDNNFFRDLLRSSPDAPDIAVFGFQELVDLEDKKVTARMYTVDVITTIANEPQGTLFKSKKKDNTDHEKMSHQYRAWKDHLQDCLNKFTPSREPYTLLHTSNLVGLFTCVFVKSSIRNQIRDVDAAEVKLGMKGRYGNKGALLIRFILDDSSVCFVNCHLAAGQRQTIHRNNDIAGIMESCVLKANQDTAARSEYFVSGGDGSMVLDHEICILNGDLNYRIDMLSRDIVIREVNAGNLAKLLERDQLLLSRKKNPGFRLRAFQEKEITFPPTYKYDVGSDRYDSSEKKRSPAWCDRILYRGIGRIKQTEYRRHEVRVSDHRPVSGHFKLRVKTINKRRRTEALGRSEQRFEDLKHRIAMDIKFDYLTNVFGMTRKEAETLLKKKK
ncbi:DNase I-like protein [Venturia nashicola]|nr:DNase I-like protein [Venturia nashicola]